MISTDPGRIHDLTSLGHWGDATLHSLLDGHARDRGELLAVKDQPDRQALSSDAPLSLSWRELAGASINLARQLQDSGLSAGDVLLVQLPNIVELLVLYYAASRLGVIVSPVPVQYGAHELRSLCSSIRPAAVVTLPMFKGEELATRVAAALPDVQQLVFGQELVVDSRDSSDRDLPVVANANQVLSVCWTSGTTGTPKGVPRTHNMWLATARCTAAAGNMLSTDVLLNPFPLVNMAGLGGFLFPAAQLGCAVVLHHPLDPSLYLQQLQDERVTFTIAPPALLNQLAKNPEMWRRYDFSALRRIGSGSAPLAPWMIETFSREFGKEVVNFYGSNEGIALFATPESAPAPEVRAAMFPVPAADAMIKTRVADPDTGAELMRVGERGELLIAGATVFDGYLEHDNTTVFSDDGYFRSGDLVEICGEGGQCYRIVGRCKDIINRGGMKISPTELDVALEAYPGLGEAAVCAYPDERLGEKVCVCVVPLQGEKAPTLEDLREFLLGSGFAKFKLPERLELYEQLPRNPLGKVQRFRLQDDLARKLENNT